MIIPDFISIDQTADDLMKHIKTKKGFESKDLFSDEEI